MCIQWCCKNCSDKLTVLTHTWARDRCNEFYIARSQDNSITDCPKGPWELRRASHRHPYRGAQRCDDCIKASRKDSKLQQSARQKANVALGQPPEYTGALYLGELDFPDTFRDNAAQRLLEPHKVDAMKSMWESFSAANEHLPSHEVERRWASRFTAFSDVGHSAGVRNKRQSKLASDFGQRMGDESRHQRSTADSEQVSRWSSQVSQHHCKSDTYGPDERSRGTDQYVRNRTNTTVEWPSSTTVERADSRSAYHHVPHNAKTTTKRPNVTTPEQANSLHAHQYPINPYTNNQITTTAANPIPQNLYIQNYHNTHSETHKITRITVAQERSSQTSINPTTTNRNTTTLTEPASQTPYTHLPHNINSETNGSNRTTIEQNEPYPSPHSQAPTNTYSTTTRASSSQPTRTRPWDL